MFLKRTTVLLVSSLLTFQTSFAATEAEQLGGFVTKKRFLKAGSVLVETNNLNKLYAFRSQEPIWIRNGTATAFAPALKQMIFQLSAKHGLIATDYWNSELESYYNSLSADNAMAFEVAATEAFIRFSISLSDGRLEPALIDNDIRLNKRVFSDFKVLAQAVSATPGMMGDIIETLAPQHQLYKDAVDILASLRKIKSEGGFKALKKPAAEIKLGAKNPLVPAIRERVNQQGYKLTGTDDTYDQELSNAIQEIQKENGFDVSPNLKNDSGFWVIVSATVDQRIAQVEATIEKLRWLPKQLESDMIFVNTNSTEARVYANSQVIKSFRTINGRVLRRTPVLRAWIGRVIFNPKWTATDSVVIQDKLPILQKDLSYLTKARMKLFSRASGAEVDPTTLDWNRDGRKIARENLFVMDPGPKNALGVFKFPLAPSPSQPMGTNSDDIFMHFTDDPSLFAKQGVRHLSSGCIRLEMAQWVAGYLLRNVPGYDAASIEKLISKGTPNEVYQTDFTVMLPQADIMPVYTIPLTVEKTASGKPRFMRDHYLQDRRIQASILAASLRTDTAKAVESSAAVNSGIKVEGQAGPSQQFANVIAVKCDEPDFTVNAKTNMRLIQRKCQTPVQFNLNSVQELQPGNYILAFENSIYPGFVKVQSGQITTLQLQKIIVPPQFAKSPSVKVYRDMTTLAEQKKIYFEKFYLGKNIFRQTVRSFGDFYIAGMGDIDVVGSSNYNYCSENVISKLRLATDIREQAKFVCESYNQANSMMDYADLYRFSPNATFQEAFADYPGDVIPKRHLRYLVSAPLLTGEFVSVFPGVYRIASEDAKLDIRAQVTVGVESYTNVDRKFANSQTGVEDDSDLSTTIGTAPAVAVNPVGVGQCASALLWRTNARSYCTSDNTEGCARTQAQMCQEIKLDLRFRK